MSGCCSAARSVIIEATVLRVEGETCDRCSGTIDAARVAARELEAELVPLNVPVTLIEHASASDRIADSNTVLVNGRPVESWIGAQRVSTDCPSCGDLLGESTCCSAITVDDELHESYSVDQIREAAFAALGLGDACGCG